MAAEIRFRPGGAVARLRAVAAEDWDAVVAHRFVDELFAGTLADDALASYLVQDYQFFDAFISMIGACVACADTTEAKLRFSAQLGMLASDEDGYFQRAFDELGVPEADRTDPKITPTTAGFRDQMYGAAQSLSYPDLLVMLVIAEWLYLDWGERDDATPERYVHSEWIALHRGEAFSSWVQFLVGELDRVVDAPTPELEARWAEAMGFERAFFDDVFA